MSSERTSLLHSGELDVPDSSAGTPARGRIASPGLRWVRGSSNPGKGSQHLQQQQHSTGPLVDCLHVLPTESRKLAGLKDLGMCALVLLPYLLMKVFRFVMGKLGVSEHRWKGVPNDIPLTAAGRKYLRGVASQLQSAVHLDIRSFLERIGKPGPLALNSSSTAATAGGVANGLGVLQGHSSASSLMALAAGATGGGSAGSVAEVADGGVGVAANGDAGGAVVFSSLDKARQAVALISGGDGGGSPAAKGSPAGTPLGAVLSFRNTAAAVHTRDEGGGDVGQAAELVLGHLYDVVLALEQIAAMQGLPLADAARQEVYARFSRAVGRLAQQEAVNPQDVYKALRNDGTRCLSKLAKLKPGLGSAAVAKEYTTRCLMLSSLRVPSVAVKPLDIDGGVELYEASEPISLQPGLEYLRMHGDKYQEHVQFMEEFPRMRPSDVKKEWQAQGMAINARWHMVYVKRPDGSVTEVACHLRSGAFAVHGRKPKGVGLSALVEGMQALAAMSDRPQERARLLDKLGYQSAEAIEPEVQIRSVCCVAQALPVVVASLQRATTRAACWEAAARCGSFLHVQQSLLSDLNAHEHSYLEDTKGALDLLSSRLEVRFAPRPVTQLALDRTTGRVTLTLDSALVPEAALPVQPPAAAFGEGASRQELLARAYRFQGLLFSQGVNVLQSLGFFAVGNQEEVLQDRLNAEALQALNTYAKNAGRVDGPALAALNQHYSPSPPGGRAAKDVEAIQLVRRAATEVGAVRAVNCKSGKDRTAIELSVTCPLQVIEAGLVAVRRQRALQTAFQAGLSYDMTGENNGQPNAYAFSELELVAMPPCWRPNWQLCGKVMS